MWRIIIRLSLNKDDGSKVRNYIAAQIGMTLNNTGTGIWESPAVQPADAVAAVTKLLAVVENPAQANSPQCSLDHVWVYIDKTDPSVV